MTCEQAGSLHQEGEVPGHCDIMRPRLLLNQKLHKTTNMSCLQRNMLKPFIMFFSFVVLAPVLPPCTRPPELFRWDFSFAEKLAGVLPSSEVNWVVHCWMKKKKHLGNDKSGVSVQVVSTNPPTTCAAANLVGCLVV